VVRWVDSGEALPASLPVTMKVVEVRRESRRAVTLMLDRRGRPEAARLGLDLEAFRPGQFFMLWLPRVDEKPYTASYLDAERVGITVQECGPFSARLCALEPGAMLGLRGPFGRPFWGVEKHADSDRVVLIGGGSGMATLALLAEALPRATLVQGARSEDALLFRQRFPEQLVFTDDGSAGRRGLPTEWLSGQVEAGRVEMVYTCGPEPMMAAVVEICRRGGVDCQVSMERHMKCGIGVCGQCECDGRRVCLEGPVFSAEELAGMPSFGRVKRDKTGRRIPVGGASGRD